MTKQRHWPGTPAGHAPAKIYEKQKEVLDR